MDSQERTKHMRSLISQVDEVLFDEWDPIGINDSPDTFDEYSSYAPLLLKFAMRGNPESVAYQLSQLSTGHMGLHSSNRQHELFIAQKLIDIASQA